MIAVDTSAIIAIVRKEPEGEIFDELMVRQGAIIGLPTLLETRMVLGSLIPTFADAFLDGLTSRSSVRTSDFNNDMYRAAVEAFMRYGKGQNRSAKLNFGDCFSYAVAKVRGVPLLYKGNDFSQTDIEPAWRP